MSETEKPLRVSRSNIHQVSGHMQEHNLQATRPTVSHQLQQNGTWVVTRGIAESTIDVERILLL